MALTHFSGIFPVHACIVRTYVEEDARELAPALSGEVDQLYHRHRCCSLLRVFELLDFTGLSSKDGIKLSVFLCSFT